MTNFLQVKRLHVACLLATLMPFVYVTSANAGSIQITPVNIKLSPKASIAVLTVRNTGSEESVMQVSLNRWTDNAGKFVYQQTNDLVITPATFRLAPGAKQIVRIGMRKRTPISEELAYRLLVEEVPKPVSAEYPQMQLIVRQDLPVFVMPNKVKAVLDLTMECAANAPSLRITNIGNIHSRVEQVLVRDSVSKQEVGKWNSADYLLVGAKQTWDVKTQLGKNYRQLKDKAYEITALTDVGSFTANVANTCL